MQSTSALFQNNLINGVTEPKLNIAGTDYGIDSLVTMKTSGHALGDSKPTMGLAVSKEIDVTLYAQSSDIPRMAVLIPYVKTVAENSTDSEWIQKGYFYTDTREEDKATGQITLHGYDSMLKAEVSYPSVTHVWPYTDTQVVSEIAAEMGVAVDAKTTALMTAGFDVPFPAQLTMREVLANIAGLYGGCFIISDTNTLLLRCLWDVSDTAEVVKRAASGDEEPQCNSATDIPALPACTGVRFLVDDGQEVLLGDETGYVFEINCPWATAENAVFLYNKLLGLVYRPYEMSGALFNPAAEIGDSVAIRTRIMESRNVLTFPYWSKSKVVVAGITREYLDDGTILFSGETDSGGGSVYGTPFVQGITFSEPQESVVVVVEVPESFPTELSNGIEGIFACEYYSNQTRYSRVITLNTLERDRRCWYIILSPSNGVESVQIQYRRSGGEEYNGLVRPMVYIGNSRIAWEPPVGAKATVLSGLWSYEQNFNSLCRAEIAAPYEEAIDHEYPYISRAQRTYERKQRGVIASLNLLADQLNSVVETVTPAVTESDNIITFPLSDENPRTLGGLTFTYLDNGGIHISGQYATEPGTPNVGIVITNPTPVSGSPITIMVETPLDFLDRSENGGVAVFTAMNRRQTGDVYVGQMLSTTYDDKKVYSFTTTTSASRNIVIFFQVFQDGYTFQFDHTIYPQILLSDTVADWTQPVGSRNSEIDALRSEITQTAEAIIAYVEREVANVSTSGYNLLGLPYNNSQYKPGQTYTISDVAITINTDGSITFNGTSTSAFQITLIAGADKFELPNSDYIIGFGTDDISTGMTYSVRKSDEAGSTSQTIVNAADIADDSTFTWNPTGTLLYLYLFLTIDSGVTFSNFTIYPQLEYGDKLHDWQPVALSAKTTVTETADGLEVEISKKVGSDEVITKINASAEGITINTNKLNLTGVLTATDVSASGSTVINGSRISGGTITLGGQNNGNGVVRVLDANGNQVFLANNTGMTAIAGKIGEWVIDTNGLSYQDPNGNRFITLDPTTLCYEAGVSTTSYFNLGLFQESGQNFAYALRFFGYDSSLTYAEEKFRLSQKYTGVFHQTGIFLNNTRLVIFNGLSDDYSAVIVEILPSNTYITVKTGLRVSGDFVVFGEKNRVIKTKDYGERLLSAYETAEPYFGDIGQSVIGEDGKVDIPIDQIFAETVRMDIPYQVFLQKEGQGDLWVSDKADDHFTVQGTPGLPFAWELKAKQIDSNGRRLEEYQDKSQQAE